MRSKLIKFSLISAMFLFTACGDIQVERENISNLKNEPHQAENGIALLSDEAQNGYALLKIETNKFNRANGIAWSNINSLSNSADVILKVTSDNKFVYILIDSKKKIEPNTVIMINSDNNHATGFQAEGWSDTGFDYLIGTTGVVYKMNTNSSNFKISRVSDAALYTKSSKRIELKVRKSDIKVGDSFDLGIQSYNSDWEIVDRLPSNRVVAHFISNNNNPNPNPQLDRTPPVITLNGPSNITLQKGEAYIEEGAIAIDDVDGNIKVSINGRVNINRAGTYTITYSVRDRAGNRSSRQRVVRVVDKVNPNPNPHNENIIIDANPSEWNNIAVLGKSGDKVLKVTSDKDFVYVLIDSPSSIEANSVVMFNSDNNHQTGYQSSNWSETGFDYLIGTTGNLYKMTSNNSDFRLRYIKSVQEYRKSLKTIEMKIKKSDIKVAESFEVVAQSYNDDWDISALLPSDGKVAHFISNNNPNPNPQLDRTPPVITLNGPSNITLQKGEVYIEEGAIAIDDVDGNIKVSINGRVNINRAGTYTITYSARDRAGNRSSRQRVVRVVDQVVVPNDKIMIIDSSNSTPPNIVLHDGVPQGAYYRFINDPQKGYVLQFHSHWIENSYHILGYDATERYVWDEMPEYQNRLQISWDSKFSGDFIIYVVLRFKTANGDVIQKDLVYTPSPNGYANYTGSFMHIYLGRSAKDGRWHHYKRDLLRDLRRFYPGATIDYNDNGIGEVNGFAVRGSGYITNLALSKR